MAISLPHSWSELSWQQLCLCWSVKIRYGGNADVARAAALLELVKTHPLPLPDMEGSEWHVERGGIDTTTGEQQYLFTPLHTGRGRGWVFTPRELSQMARQSLPWFDWPYGDPGEKEERDEKGKVVKERREPVAGYVSAMRDAMVLPETEIVITGDKMIAGSDWEQRKLSTLNSPLSTLHFSLPQVACNNLTWQQYRSMQAIAPQLFSENITDEQTLDLQAQFLAQCLVPAKSPESATDKFRPKTIFRYDAERAEQTVDFWKEQLAKDVLAPLPRREGRGVGPLFHICFQVYQTAILYYEKVYPLLFGDSGKNDPMRDALTGEVGTINTIMKYAGYAEQQQVYDSNLPFVLDILNTMTKEAKEIEKMNAKIRKK